MGKSRSAAAAAAAAAVPAAADLPTLIQTTSLFLDHLVELIPARFYLPSPDDGDATPFKFLSKPDKAAARLATRDHLKTARRSRLDPDHPSSTLHLLHRSIPAPAPDDADDTVIPDNPSVTYEDLRHRLRLRIDQLRSTRNTRSDNNNNHPENKKSLQRIKHAEEKRKRKGEPEPPPAQAPAPAPAPAPAGADDADLTFGQVKVGGEERRKKQKLSKAQELERAKRLEESRKEDPKVARKHSWKAAESRAMGVKVHDDPKLLKESIKKERRRHQKNAEQWRERVESRGKERAEKQKTRTDNIKERAQNKKARKIEKREKKLMRPGFEGRKEGYVNK